MLNNYDIIGMSNAFENEKAKSKEDKIITWRKYKQSYKLTDDNPVIKYLFNNETKTNSDKIDIDNKNIDIKFTDSYEYRLKIMTYDWRKNWMPIVKEKDLNNIYYFNEPEWTIEASIINFNCSFSNNKSGACSSYNFEVVYDQNEITSELYFNKVCKFIIGIRSLDFKKNPEGKIVWIGLGCGIINQPSFKINKAARSWNFSATDLICLLDGTRLGSPPSNRVSYDKWVYEIDKPVKENLIKLLKTYSEDISKPEAGFKGVNFIPDDLNVNDYFEECRDLKIVTDKIITDEGEEKEETRIDDALVLINKKITLDNSNNIFSVIKEIIQYSNPQYTFYFDNHGVPTYCRDPLYGMTSGFNIDENASFKIVDSDIISLDFKQDFTNAANSVNLYGFTRDVTAIKDNLYSGELICDGETHIHPTTEQSINTSAVYDSTLDCYILYTFCDLLPCELEDFEYKGDKSWGCNTIFFEEKWFDHGAKPILICVNDVALSTLYPSSEDNAIYSGCANILVWERIDEEPYVYDPETSYWQWQAHGKKQFKASKALADIGFKGYKTIEGVQYSGYIDKTINNSACNTNEKALYTAFYELFNSISKKYQLSISVPLFVWLKPNMLIQYNVDDHLGDNEYSFINFSNPRLNHTWTISNINFTNGISTIQMNYSYYTYFDYLDLARKNTWYVENDKTKIITV